MKVLLRDRCSHGLQQRADNGAIGVPHLVAAGLLSDHLDRRQIALDEVTIVGGKGVEIDHDAALGLDGEEVSGSLAIGIGETDETLDRDGPLATLICTHDGGLELPFGMRLDITQ